MCPRRARSQGQQGFLDSNGVIGIEIFLGVEGEGLDPVWRLIFQVYFLLLVFVGVEV